MRNRPARLTGVLATVLPWLLAAIAPAASADPLGLYLGAGLGQANVKLDQIGFAEHHSGWKAIAGLRPIPVFGVELEYIDFGDPSATVAAATADVHVRGSALYGVLYAPLPVPLLDLYAKAGFSRLQTTGTATTVGIFCPVQNPNCGLFRLDRTDTQFAIGAGAQVKISAFALRAEYEHFNSSSGSPGFWSLALIWNF